MSRIEIAEPGAQRPKRARETAAGTPRPTPQLTEMDVRTKFEADAKGRRLFEHRSNSWYVERNGIWQRDELRETTRAVQILCETIGGPFATLKKVKAVEELARSAPGIACTTDDFDREPYLLGTPRGLIDLRTGDVLPPDPGQRITMSTAVEMDRSCKTPLWHEFLKQVTGDDIPTIRFLQSWFGYCLTGDTREQKMVFAYGAGRNGKGVATRVVTEIMGTYAHRARTETFTAGMQGHATEMAAMRGTRLVHCSETERGKSWAEGRIKEVTGGDRLRANFMRQDFFEFQPEFKLFVIGNYEPAIATADPAMRNRFYVVPFDQEFTAEKGNLDQHLYDKLKSEWPGILAWLVDGCLFWQEHGLVAPDKVRAATDAYFERQDVFAQWLAQETVAGAGLSDHQGRLFGSWTSFAKENGEEPGTSKTFAERLERAGFKKKDAFALVPGSKKLRGYSGLKGLF
jgi:putative DNA primase/helicase